MSVTKTFVDHLKPILYLCKILGVVYFPINENSSEKRLVFLWFVPLLSCYVYSLYRGLVGFFNNQYVYETYVARITELIEIILSTLHVIVRATSSIANSNDTKRLLARIQTNAEILNIKTYSNVYISIIILSLGELIGFTTDVFLVVISENQYNLSHYMCYQLTFFTGVVECLYIYQILNGICVQYGAITKQLQNELDVIKREKIESNFQSLRYVRIVNNKATEKLLEKVENIADQFYELAEVSKQVNRIFSVQILVALGVDFAFIVVHAHYAASSIRLVIIGYKATIPIVPACVWILILALNVLFIILPWTQVTYQVKDFLRNVQICVYVHGNQTMYQKTVYFPFKLQLRLLL